MSNQGPAANRFSVARSSHLITGGLIVVVVGWVVRVLAADAVASYEDGSAVIFYRLGLLVILVGAATAITGFAYLSANVDYVAAREAERHRLAWKTRPVEDPEH